MSTLKLINVEARDLPDAWTQCVFKALEQGNAIKRMVDEGSFKGTYRLEFDYMTIHITYPGVRPLIPDIPQHLGIPNPVENMEKVEKYFTRYLMSAIKEGDEQYTYGERMVGAWLLPISHIKKEHTYFQEDETEDRPKTVNQIDELIERYKQYGFGNNQLMLRICQPADIMLKDPPCLCHIDTRIKEGKLHFIIYFRSWDLWSGLPENLGGIQLLKEYMSQGLGVEDGEMICASKGLHLYGYTWEIAGKRRGLTEGEMKLLTNEVKLLV